MAELQPSGIDWSQWLTLSQAATALGVSDTRVRALVAANRLDVWKTPLGQFISERSVRAEKAKRVRRESQGYLR